MKTLPLLAFLLLGVADTAAVSAEVDRHDVVWDSPSDNAHGSMPIGNGDIGLNAWVEPSGDLVLLIGKTDAWDENGRLCKVGRVRVKLDPPLATTAGFVQRLKLHDGVIEITNATTRIRLWVDATEPVIRLEAAADAPVGCHAAVELWRTRERPLHPDDDGHSGKDLDRVVTPPPTVLADVVVPPSTAGVPDDAVTWYHHDTRSIFPFCLAAQHLESLQGRFPDPLLDRIFGGVLAGRDFIRDGAQAVRSKVPARDHAVSISVVASRVEPGRSPVDELRRLDALADRDAPFAAHAAWWHTFWDRSWVFVEGNEPLTRGYVLQRYMNACAGRGGAPIKFNGSIFTVEQTPAAAAETPAGNPDWRRWGGNYWFQNTRLIYWPMLAAGDFDLMNPWFRMYRDALPLSEARIRASYGFAGAAQFPETMYFWGLPNVGDYGIGHAGPEPASPYIARHWNGSLELIAALLDRHEYTGDEAFARDTLLPLADPLISFLDQRWHERDAEGKRLLQPAQALETWQTAVNPTPDVAGLRHVLPRLLALPASITTERQRARWKTLLDELPPVPVAAVDGTQLIRPALRFSTKSNTENVELYAVFPFRLYGVGRPDLDIARATYAARGSRHNGGWCQDSIQAACLGLADEAGRLVDARARNVNAAYRFPAMWGPGFDWIPDQDHGANIMTTLQAMLVQPVNDTLHVLPAWPRTWDVSFKLHAPRGTTIEGVYRSGEIESLHVTPASRRGDVVLPDDLR